MDIKRGLLFLTLSSGFTFFTFSALLAQDGVLINYTGGSRASSAILDLQSSDQGLLAPRVTLTATNAAGPITSPAISLLVYNLVTAGAPPNDVTPGYYYWDGSWKRLMSSGNTPTGSGTLNRVAKWTPSGNQLGDSQIWDNGTNVGIGVSPAYKLDVSGTMHVSDNSFLGPITPDYPFKSAWTWQSDNSGYYAGIGYQKTDGTAKKLHMWWIDNVLETNINTVLNVATPGHTFDGTAPNTGRTVGAKIASSGDSYFMGGNVGIGITNPTFKLHVPSGYIGTDYLNSTDNSVGAGVSGIMVKAGDNYLRTGTAAAIATFLGTSLAGNYIQNGTSAQSANFNITGTGKIGTYGTLASTPTTYGSLSLADAKNGYYGLLFGQSIGNPNLMYDGAGNGGSYYENWGWSQYYLTGSRHMQINTASDLGASLGVSGNLRATGGATLDYVANGTLAVGGGSIGGTDAVIYVEDQSNNDWGIKITKGAYDYGMNIDVANSASYAFRILGTGSERFRVRGDGVSYQPFIYDNDNTGYYLDPNSSSRMSVNTTDDNYTYGWFRNYTVNYGLYNQNTGNHWYSSSAAYWNIGGGSGTNTGIIFRNGHQGAIQGYTYSDGSGFGLLHSGGGWALRTTTGLTEAYNDFYSATSYQNFIYDRNNTGYYMDPESTSRMYYGDYNYLHTQTNDSWFPYTGNNWNYFRGSSYINNAVWYDENNTGYYMDLNGGNRIAYLYQGVGAYNVGGWTSGIIQTENTSDGHQYNPVTGNWGYVGTSGQYWYYMYSNNFIDPSRREIKRNITPLSSSSYDLVMSDIDRIQPSFYKYKAETDELEAGNEAKYRANMHLGVILDESPDYIQDQAFSGIDIYAMATLGVAGVKYNREEIKNLKQGVGMSKITDFGSSKVEDESVWVSFDESFSDQLVNGEIPVVSLTPNEFGTEMIVTEKRRDGFLVKKTGSKPVDFDWMAMVKVNTSNNRIPVESINSNLLEQLRVDESRKVPIKAYWEEQKENNQAEHARQAEEQERTVKIGTDNYMKTVNPENKNKPPLTNYDHIQQDEPAQSGNIPDSNESKEGAPTSRDLTPRAANPELTEPHVNESFPKTENKSPEK